MSKRRVRTISKRTKYGLQALFALARRYGQGPVLIATLAKEEGIPLKFLESILLELKSWDVVESKRGPRGGYRLSKPPSKITVGAIVRLLEGPLAPLPCASETAYRACDDCADVEHCGTRMVMRQVRDAIAGVLDRTTLEHVVRQVGSAKEKKLQQEALMYYI
jgi:Rrf2 family protein